MFYEKIERVIPEKKILCVSPHYDDFLFFLGAYVLEMKKSNLLDTKEFTNISVFSRSNYQERDIEGNRDQSLQRVQYATGIRLIEDLECLDYLLGAHNYVYRVLGENESQVRGKLLNEGEGEMEMAFGSYETLDEGDFSILERLKDSLSQSAMQEDTAIVLPLSMKGHIDHFIVREAGVYALNQPTSKAAFYFAEDKPYAGLMNEEESAVNDDFIKKMRLTDKTFAYQPEEILRIAYRFYPSQVDRVYDEGIRNRASQLRQQYDRNIDCDRLYQVKATPHNSSKP